MSNPFSHEEHQEQKDLRQHMADSKVLWEELETAGLITAYDLFRFSFFFNISEIAHYRFSEIQLQSEVYSFVLSQGTAPYTIEVQMNAMWDCTILEHITMYMCSIGKLLEFNFIETKLTTK